MGVIEVVERLCWLRVPLLFLFLLVMTAMINVYGDRLIKNDFIRRNHKSHWLSVLNERNNDNGAQLDGRQKLAGMLFPQESESRSLRSLNGMWDFRLDDSADRQEGLFRGKWFSKPLAQTGRVEKMPVPSSFNDVGTDVKTRDFVGWAWYEKQFFFRPTEERVVLRFGSVHYYAMVWINGVFAKRHIGGHLPFEVQVLSSLSSNSSFSNLLHPGQWNRITVAVNNTLTPTTIPPGVISWPNPKNPNFPPGYFSQTYQFDFFNYAGIHRPVTLYTTPRVHVEDISLKTDVIFGTNSSTSTTGRLSYDVFVGGGSGEEVQVEIEILDVNDTVVAKAATVRGALIIANPHLWWPWNMNPKKEPAYLYIFKVSITAAGVTDIYRLKFGIRSLKWTHKEILINERPFYCKGVGKHEDSHLRGKGYDDVLVARDFRLLKWLGCNCFRTSHYPYAEEILNMADEEGIVVISEAPGVGMKKKENFVPEVLTHHLNVMDELFQRDKNRPSVIMWSVANEPGSKKPFTRKYFKILINHTKELDSSRPVTFVIGGGSTFANDQAAEFVDIICINHYFAWYHDPGRLDVITAQTLYDLTQWHRTFNKSVILSEFGAGAVGGLHQLPGVMFTEDYQSSTLASYWSSLDRLRRDFLVGEMIWNFADFNTAQKASRVAGNRKGLFTRERQPKMAAYVVRDRWLKMKEYL